MLAGLFGAAEEADEQTSDSIVTEGPEGSSAAEAGPSSAGAPLVQTGTFNFWNVASVVSNTMKARADELLKGVAQTDWKSELMAFSKEVSDDTATLKAKAEELVEQLPEALGQDLPSQMDSVTSAVSGFIAPPSVKPGGGSSASHAAPGAAATSSRSSIRTGAGSDLVHNLEDVGGSLTSFGKSLLLGTKELLEQVRDAVESEIAVATKETKRGARSSGRAAAAKLAAVQQQKKYSRFESEVSAMQRDSSTYCDEPEDVADYAAWRATISLDAMSDEIQRTVSSAAFMAELQERIVPGIVQHEDFWLRYFYRYHKLQAKEEARQQLAARAKSLQAADEVDVGWGDDDEEEAVTDVEDLTAPAADDDAVDNAELATAAAALAHLAELESEAGGSDPAADDHAAPEAVVPAVASSPEPAAAEFPEPAPPEQETAADSPTSPSAESPAAAGPNLTSPPSSAAQPSAPESSEFGSGGGGVSTSKNGSSGGSSLVGHGGSPSPEHLPEGSDPESATVETASDTSSNGGGKGEWYVVGSPSAAAAAASATTAAVKAGLSPASAAAAGVAAAASLLSGVVTGGGRRSSSGAVAGASASAQRAPAVDSGSTTPTKASKSSPGVTTADRSPTSTTASPNKPAAGSPTSTAQTASPSAAVDTTHVAISPTAASSPAIDTTAAALPTGLTPATVPAEESEPAAAKPDAATMATAKPGVANSDEELEEAWGDWD